MSQVSWLMPYTVGDPIYLNGDVVGKITEVAEDGTIKVTITQDAAFAAGLAQLGGISIAGMDPVP